jgi:hypothetical protein
MAHTTPIPHRRHRWRLTRPAAIGLLALAFATALFTPLPVAPNPARAQVVANVEQRLPGWNVERARSSWEGAWNVVATCGYMHLGFQLVPGHGLRPGSAWLHPEDQYSRDRLSSISDSWRTLIWFAEPIGLRHKTLSCSQEMARLGGGTVNLARVPPGVTD